MTVLGALGKTPVPDCLPQMASPVLVVDRPLTIVRA